MVVGTVATGAANAVIADEDGSEEESLDAGCNGGGGGDSVAREAWRTGGPVG